MNGYGLSAEIIKALASLAWPVAFVVVVCVFRKELVKLLPRIRVKHNKWDVSFRLDDAEETLRKLPPPPPPEPESEPTEEEDSKFEKVLEASPRAAILEARVDVEEAVRSLACRSKLLTPRI